MISIEVPLKVKGRKFEVILVTFPVGAGAT